ncbi:hypothetical protein CLV62_11883 [Dysgonomonas alginatilytica]|uniref:Uncharacterized protein n=1 Tax=Dysgonomonas alginatilytica TaxID=1605892 RepID=A0A2V3PNX1_9BACT|nr:hypothetical protein [Dysgonomonas alginatilytica]PXV62694.1 hypothetical protein CLV62_11883 [Dysgonomonas alginatilytica]
MNKAYTTLIFLLILFIQSGNIVGKDILTTPLKRTDILNIGSIAYPANLEERSDIPFKLLVDEEFKKLMSDSVNYEQFRPTLIFFERGFKAPKATDKKTSFGYITVTALSGKYRFPKQISDVQKAKIESNIKQDVDTNLIGTQFQVKKWDSFDFKTINGLIAIQYSYEQTLKGKNPTNITTTNLYDSDVQLQIVLSAPKKEYKKWLAYYNQIVETFKRKVNIADIATFEYPTDIQERKDIPFKLLVDNEFKKILGESVDYEQFRPGLLFLNRNFEIADSTNIPPFGSISFNVLPDSNPRTLKKDSLNRDLLQENIKKNVQQNLDSTDYKINNWGSFEISELEGVPILQYSYEQQLRNNEASKIYAAYLFDKSGQIQLTMSSPLNSSTEWKNRYDKILASYQRLVAIPNIGTMFYPVNLEERSDIPFVTLVDKESKKKLGDSIDYERFRPTLLFLKRDFNENDPNQLESFSSITINTQEGNFSRLSHPDSMNIDTIQYQMKASVERNLQNTGYSLISWDSFNSSLSNGTRIISYSYTQQLEGLEPKHIGVTYFYTEGSQTLVTLTSSESEYSFWKPEYEQMIQSFRLSGQR